MLECSVLIFEFDEFLLVPFEYVDLILEMSDDEVFLVWLNLVGGVVIWWSFGVAHLLLKLY